MSDTDSFELDGAVALVGMAGRFPGAPDVATLWANLCQGVEAITPFSDEELLAAGVSPERLRDPSFVKAGAVLDGIELFDAAFFGFIPREAEITDPQQRLFLECAWEALEHAGYDPETYPGAIGVYAGSGMNTYLLNNLLANRAMAETVGLEQIIIANDKDFLTTRVSYKLNLRGPSLNVQTACSTSLVAVHLAAQGLLSGECDMALAGGASVQVPQTGYSYHEGGILSPDGHCRAFDAQARGTVFGNAVAIVVLKRLADALAEGDQIYAIIKGSAINNDGALKGGFTAPSVVGQALVIAEALAVARVDPATIAYVEAHGTGTELGDPIEVAALTRAFGANLPHPGFCALGSLKTNLGHLDRASGVTGLIKTALALKHERIPPTLHFTAPNPKIDFAGSPFYVNTSLAPWPTGAAPRRAGVSSLGIGGTNAHMVLEEAPAVASSGPARPWQLLMLSARTATALEAASGNLARHLRAHPELPLADVAYTLQIGRRAFAHRRALVCRDHADALAVLEGACPERVLGGIQDQSARPVAFLFPGQGAQYGLMAAQLYQSEPAFRETVDHCAELLTPHLGLDLRALIFEAQPSSEPQQLDQTAYTQPALFVVEYALARLWMAWGIKPAIMLGHSVGEYVAACLAGVFALEDALALVAGRGRLMQALPGGAMLSVPLSEEALRPQLGAQLELAAINGPSLCVVTGPEAPVEALARRLEAQGVSCRRLHTSHAFHSAMMEPMLEQFEALVRAVRLSPPQLSYISNLSGRVVSAAEATDPAYWARHLRQTVRFAAGLATVLEDPDRLLLEVGPGRALSTLAQQHPGRRTSHTIITSLPSPRDNVEDVAHLLGAMGRLWLAGVTPTWARFYADERRLRVPLPTYPFERQRYWIDPPAEARQVVERSAAVGARLSGAPDPEQEAARDGAERRQPALHARPDLPTPYIAPRNEVEQAVVEIWQELLGIGPIGVYDSFFELGGHSLLATQVVSRIRQKLGVDLALSSVFDAQTVAELTVALAQAMAAQAGDVMLAELLAELEEEQAATEEPRPPLPAADVTANGAASRQQPSIDPDAERSGQRFEVDTAGLSLHELIQTNRTAANPNGAVIKERTRAFYNSISEHLSTSVYGEYATFLNYGYVADASTQEAVLEIPWGAVNRNSLKLVLELIGPCELSGCDVLDISCGRGGTLAAIAQHFRPRRMVGGDLSPANIAFCERHHAAKGITFQLEDADQLTFPDGSFDVVTNIEASHLYPNVYRFYGEVWRVLRPGGSFLYTDLFDAHYAAHNLPMLRELGFVIERDRDITANVLLSCDEAARRNLKAYTSGEGSERLNAFLAMPGSQPYQDLQESRLQYRILRLRKP